MKTFRAVGLTLVMLCALGAAQACTASAVEGLLPLNQEFTILSKSISYESTSKEKWLCGETKGTGKFETSSDTHGVATLEFLRCEVLGFPAFSLGEKEPKETKEAAILEPVTFSVCLINSASLKFGLFLQLAEVVHVHIKSLGVLLNLSGSFIGELLTARGKLLVLDVNGKEGKPAVKECKDEAGNVKNAELKEEDDPNAPLAQSVQLEGGLLQFATEVELMDQ